MKIIRADISNWHVECIPDDGARISVLQFKGKDMLTRVPGTFRPPEKFYGEYETRPVFGYDDCFPTVDPCSYPENFFECRDHGELCWKKWQARFACDSLFCYTKCIRPKVTFKRTLEFTANSISWQYEVVNLADRELPFLHVMHALMPLNEIAGISFPDFESLTDENSVIISDIKKPGELTDFLLSLNAGSYRMILLKNVAGKTIDVVYRNGLALQIEFPMELFSTIGVWWNNSGYPDEEGLRRCECAIEPIPGTCSNLSESYRAGTYLKTEP
jgi:hypothetical protein